VPSSLSLRGEDLGAWGRRSGTALATVAGVDAPRGDTGRRAGASLWGLHEFDTFLSWSTVCLGGAFTRRAERSQRRRRIEIMKVRAVMFGGLPSSASSRDPLSCGETQRAERAGGTAPARRVRFHGVPLIGSYPIRAS